MKLPKTLSRFRKLYHGRFIFRCGVLILSILLYIFCPSQFDIMYGWNFFRRFSVFHIFWLLWMVDMILQMCPCRKLWPLGSQKFLKACFDPILQEISREGLIRFVKKSRRDTLLIGLTWAGIIAAVGVLYFTGVIDRAMLLVISVVFYVCDIICVLFWCPFRVWFMKNRCCTTCRIFNWDHMMMFAPLLFVPGFFTWSLCLAALIVLLMWEITFAMHPERFWDGSNRALRCSSCTDQLCGQRNCSVDIPDIGGLQP